jgi:hypothetical protein
MSFKFTYTDESRTIIKKAIGGGHCVIPDGVITIGFEAFKGCKNLISIYLGNSLITICDHAFNGCNKLEQIIFGDYLKTIGEYAFGSCNNIIRKRTRH